MIRAINIILARHLLHGSSILVLKLMFHSACSPSLQVTSPTGVHNIIISGRLCETIYRLFPPLYWEPLRSYIWCLLSWSMSYLAASVFDEGWQWKNWKFEIQLFGFAYSLTIQLKCENDVEYHAIASHYNSISLQFLHPSAPRPRVCYRYSNVGDNYHGSARQCASAFICTCLAIISTCDVWTGCMHSMQCSNALHVQILGY